MSLESPLLLFLLIPVILCWIYAWRMPHPSIRVSSIETVQQLQKQSGRKTDWRKMLPMLCFLF